MKFFAKLRRLFRRGETERGIGDTLETQERPFPVLEGLEPLKPDRASATKLLTLASFVATLIDHAGDEMEEDARTIGRGLVLFAISQAAAAKLGMAEWMDALWHGRDIFLRGPGEERLALLAAAEVLVLDADSRDDSVRSAPGLFPHFRGRLSVGTFGRFVELRMAARELSCLQTIKGIADFHRFMAGIQAAVDESCFGDGQDAREGPDQLWPSLFPWQARVGVA